MEFPRLFQLRRVPACTILRVSLLADPEADLCHLQRNCDSGTLLLSLMVPHTGDLHPTRCLKSTHVEVSAREEKKKCQMNRETSR